MSYTVKFKPTNIEYKKMLLDILDHLATIPEDYQKDMVYTSTEFDGNQTEYEQLSNNLKIGVKAKSDIVGTTLSLFLRAIIDHNYGIIATCIYDDYFDQGNTKKADIETNLQHVVQVLAKMEGAEGLKQQIDKEIEIKLSGGKKSKTRKIKKFGYEIDNLWTFDIIRKFIKQVNFSKVELILH